MTEAIQCAICRQNANSGRRYWHLSNNEDLCGTDNQVGRDSEDRIGCEPESGFDPDPVPPVPRLQFDGRLQTLPEVASVAVGGLDAVGTSLPSTSSFIYGWVRKEAVLWSQIEGTQSSLSDILPACGERTSIEPPFT